MDRTVKVWDTSSRKELYILKSHKRKVTSVSFSPDNLHLASADYLGTLKLWNLKTGEELFSNENAHKGDILSIEFSPDGKTIASAGYDGKIRFWDRNGTERFQLDGHSKWIHSIKYFESGDKLVSAGENGELFIWDIEKRKIITQLHGEISDIFNIALSKRSKLLASTSDDGVIRIWETATGKLLRKLELSAVADYATALSFCPKSNCLFAGTEKGVVLKINFSL